MDRSFNGISLEVVIGMRLLLGKEGGSLHGMGLIHYYYYYSEV